MYTYKIKYAFVVAIFLVLALGVFSNIMNHPIDHNEHMYISAGVLISENSLYKDFAFLQMPYLPFVYGTFYKLTGTSYYLLVGRFFSFFFIVLSGLLLYLISFRISRSFFVSTGMVVLFVLNQTIIITMRESSNYVMPVTFSLLAFYLFIVSVSKENINRLCLFLCGTSLAVTIGIKFYYIITLPPFFLISLIYPQSLTFKRRAVKIFLPLLAGLIVTLLPVFYYLISNFDVFMFNNYNYHLMNATKLKISGLPIWMSVSSKILFCFMELAYPTNIALFIGILFLLFIFIGKITSLNDWLKVEGLLSLLLVFFTAAVAISIKPVWVENFDMYLEFVKKLRIFSLEDFANYKPYGLQYFAMSIPFAIILVGCLYKGASGTDSYRKIVLVFILITSTIYGGAQLFRYTGKLLDTYSWTGVSIHRAAERVRKYMGQTGGDGKVATLSPLYALEGGLPIYKELATGPFLYRVGDLIPEDKMALTPGTSPRRLHALFEKDPPWAIFVGFEDYLDLPFIEYAEKNNYIKVEEDFNKGTLYVRRDRNQPYP
jgi:hypothetical protein